MGQKFSEIKVGGNVKDLLKHMKKLNSAGELVRICNTHEIGMDLLCEVCLRKAEMEKEESIKHVKKSKQKYKVIKAYVMMKSKKGDDIKQWMNGDYKIAIKAMKTDKDGRMPSKKDELIKMFNEIKQSDESIMKEYNSLVKIDMFEE